MAKHLRQQDREVRLLPSSPLPQLARHAQESGIKQPAQHGCLTHKKNFFKGEKIANLVFLFWSCNFVRPGGEGRGRLNRYVKDMLHIQNY